MQMNKKAIAFVEKCKHLCGHKNMEIEIISYLTPALCDAIVILAVLYFTMESEQNE